MDALDRKILDTLLADARTPYARIAEELGLATATVHQRVRRLRESGVITGYTAKLDWSKLDLPLAALVSISVTSRRPLSAVAEYLREIPWVVACAAVSGQFDLLVHVRAASPAHLGEIIDDIRKASKGATQTVLVLSPYFDRSAPVVVEPTSPVSDV
jgi:Lrp/AsnC family leucine-responsive transcriptional regulator